MYSAGRADLSDRDSTQTLRFAFLPTLGTASVRCRSPRNYWPGWRTATPTDPRIDSAAPSTGMSDGSRSHDRPNITRNETLMIKNG